MDRGIDAHIALNGYDDLLAVLEPFGNVVAHAVVNLHHCFAVSLHGQFVVTHLVSVAPLADDVSGARLHGAVTAFRGWHHNDIRLA